MICEDHCRSFAVVAPRLSRAAQKIPARHMNAKTASHERARLDRLAPNLCAEGTVYSHAVQKDILLSSNVRYQAAEPAAAKSHRRRLHIPAPHVMKV